MRGAETMGAVQQKRLENVVLLNITCNLLLLLLLLFLFSEEPILRFLTPSFRTDP